MPRFNAVTGQMEMEPWEIPGLDIRQAQALPDRAPPPQPQMQPQVNEIQGNPIAPSGKDNASYYNQLLKEFDMLAKQQRAMGEEDLGVQKRGIGQLEETLQAYRQLAPPIDFSPLAGAFDQIWGTNQAASLKSDTPQSRIEKLMELQNKVQMAKDQMSENRIKMAKEGLGNLIQRAGINNSRQERFDTAQIEKADLEMRNTFNKLEGAATELASTYSRLNNAFQPDREGKVSAYEVKQAMSNFARSVGGEKGVLTDSDVGRQLPATAQSQLAQLENYLFSLQDDAKIPAASIAPLRNIMEKAKGVASDRYKQDLSRLKRNYETTIAPNTKKVWESSGRIRYDDATKAIDRQFGVPAPAASGGIESEFEAWKRGK